MSSHAVPAALIDLLRTHDHFLLTSHTRPDGDAVGSLLGMGMLLEQMGKRTDLVLADEVPVLYKNLPQLERIRIAPGVSERYDAVILLECDGIARSRLEGLEDQFLINIDHHASGREFGAFNWIDKHACAVAAMVYRVAKAVGVTITPEIATCLYAAVLTDTGSFTYAGITAETFELARELVSCGAAAASIAQDVYYENPAPRIRILGTALSNLQIDGPIAYAWITLDDMLKTGAAEEDCEGVVNHLIGISGIECAVFLRELPQMNGDTRQQFRLSIRSKGGTNVARVAEYFGGGGHDNASGCTLDGPLPPAIESVLNRIRQELC